MAVSRSGALSFKVTARVGKGEQVMVCGDAPFLGGGDPDRALCLYTTPADYPLWFTKEELPRPVGSSDKAHDYRYCVYRGGRFHRWDKVEKPRVIRHSRTPQIARDTLDEELPPHRVDADPPEDYNDEDSSCVEDEPRRQQKLDGTGSGSIAIGSGEDGGTAPQGNGATPSGSSFFTAPAVPALQQQQLQMPSFTAAKTSADTESFLRTFQQQGIGPFGCVELSPATNPEEGGDDHNGGGGISAAPRLRRPPSLEAAEDGEGAGLGLGLRLGVEAMSSPPPRSVSAAGAGAGAGDKTKTGSPLPLWSPRDGGVVVASFYLPVILTREKASSPRSGGGASATDETDGWTAQWDYEQLIALQTNLHMRVIRVGTVKCDEEIREGDQAAVAKALLKLNCIPVFLSEKLTHQCYYRYCKGVLWPVMHGMLEMYDGLPNTNTLQDDKAITSGWQAYKEVNRAFRDKVVEVFHEGDMVWVHGFHLAILPAFLDRTVKVARIGLFLHTPFPPSEVFRALPHREDLLRGMLGADQVGFHRFSDSRHFISSCRRLLGLTHVQSQETGLVQIVHGGKPTIITDRHAGIDPEAVRASLLREESQKEVARLKGLHGDRIVVAGVERVEKVKGVWLKMLAFEDMLRRHPQLVGRVCMHEVGIANPARGSDYRACQESLSELAGRMNAQHGPGTVIYEERDARDATLAQRVALMSVSSVFVKTPVHNGLSIMPIEFRVVQEQRREQAKNAKQEQQKQQQQSKTSTTPAASTSPPGVLILSEAVSCSPALRGSFSVNPWQVQAVADTMAHAVTAEADDRTAWHEEDVEWCQSNTTARWAEDVLGVLSTVAKESRSRYATTGLGLTSRVVGTDPTFKRLDTNCARRAYGLSKSRVFFLDYGGTLVKVGDTHAAEGHSDRRNGSSKNAPGYSPRRGSQRSRLRPGRAVLEGLTELCRDPRNVVFVVSGRGKEELQDTFGHIQGLGLAAEHGSFFRWPQPQGATATAMKTGTEDGRDGCSGGFPKVQDRESEAGGNGDGWEALHPGLMDTAWKDVARRFMENFQIHTHGSYIEEKGTAMLWHYGDAEPEFGAMQAKQLQDELTFVLRSSESAAADAGTISANIPPGTQVGSGSTANNMDTKPDLTGGLHANTVDAATGSTAVTGSTRSTSSIGAISVASESFGSIEIIHEEGLNSPIEAGGGEAYLEVRARGASKGNFVHMVMDRLGWPFEGAATATTSTTTAGPGEIPNAAAAAASVAAPGGRFCLCVGDDVSDEDMFIAAKSYAATAPWKDHCSLSSPTSARAAGHRVEAPLSASRSSSSGKENRYPAASAYHYHSTQQQQQQQAYLLTVTVGSKPSDADAWLPGVDAVVSLLRTLGRVNSLSRDSGSAGRSRLAPHAAAVAVSSSPHLLLETGLAGGRGAHSVSPNRTFRSASTSHADAGTAATAMSTLASSIQDLSSMSIADGVGRFGRVWEEAAADENAYGGDAADASVPPGPGACGFGASMMSMPVRRKDVNVNVDLGMGVPVVRRHSYSFGMGGKPRISLSLGDFLREVAEPEPEPPMF